MGPLDEIIGLRNLPLHVIDADNMSGMKVMEEAIPERGTEGGRVVVVVRAYEDVCIEYEPCGGLLAHRMIAIFCGICSNVSPFRSVRL